MDALNKHQITQKSIDEAFLSTNLVIIIHIFIYIFGLPGNQFLLLKSTQQPTRLFKFKQVAK